METNMISPEEKKRLKGMGFINNKGTDCFSARVLTVNGKLTSAQLTTLSTAAERFGDGHVVFTNRLSAEVTGIPYEEIEEFSEYLHENGMETGGTGNRVRPIVCCKGTTCQYGLLDSYGIAEELHRRFYIGYHDVALPHKFKIAVGGCPNSCIKPDLNDIGIMGWGKGYRIFIGGRWGKKHTVGQPLGRIITDKEEMFRIVERAICLFRDQGLPGERFCMTIERLGFGEVERQLLADAF